MTILAILCANATCLPMASNVCDVIITDPPFGLQQSISLADLQSLYQRALKEMLRVLKLDGRLVMLTSKVLQSFVTSISEENFLAITDVCNIKLGETESVLFRMCSNKLAS